jgi:hypothetical protein
VRFAKHHKVFERDPTSRPSFVWGVAVHFPLVSFVTSERLVPKNVTELTGLVHIVVEETGDGVLIDISVALEWGNPAEGLNLYDMLFLNSTVDWLS